jgi:Fe-S cluster biosynthesis and repair protein YggX
MRRRFFIAVCLSGMLAAAARAEIVDRIAVSVGSRVITETDLAREIRITALLNNEKPDFSPANKRRTAERMVDQTLVRNEMQESRYPPPTAADTEAALQEEKTRYGNEAAYLRALAAYGVSEEDLKARLTWQLMLVHFIDVRFRPGIQITPEEILKYFDEHMRAAWMQAHPGQTPSVDDNRASIERTLISQAADQQVEQWLKEARRRNHIQYHDEAFQ